MQSSIFADESGDESAGDADASEASTSERGTREGSGQYRASSDGQRSIFRNPTTAAEASSEADDGDGDANATDADATEDETVPAERSASTMTVFCGDDVYEFGADDV